MKEINIHNVASSNGYIYIYNGTNEILLSVDDGVDNLELDHDQGQGPIITDKVVNTLTYWYQLIH